MPRHALWFLLLRFGAQNVQAEAARLLASLYRDPALYRSIQRGCEASAREYDSTQVLEQLVKEMM